jgi:hypothetical protein
VFGILFYKVFVVLNGMSEYGMNVHFERKEIVASPHSLSS